MRSQYPRYTFLIKKVLNGNFLVLKKALGKANSALGCGLTREERTLLKARVLIHTNKIPKAREVLQLVHGSNDFFRAEASFLLGTVEFLEGHHEAAIIANQTAADRYKKIGDERGQFLAQYNMAVDYEKLGLIQLAKISYEQSKKHCQSATEHWGYARAMVSIYAGEGRYRDALRELEHVNAHVSELEVVDRHAWELLRAHVCVLNGDLNQANTILKKVIQSKRCKEKARVFFELQLVKFLLEGASLPPPIRVPRQFSEVHTKWSLLYMLQHGRINEASALWDTLVKKYPVQFSHHFRVSLAEEQQSLFGRCLTKLCHSETTAMPTICPPANTKRDMPGVLLQILKDSATPLSKEDLIELIWERYHSAYDARLYKLVERTKKKYRVNIISAHRAYSIGTEIS